VSDDIVAKVWHETRRIVIAIAVASVVVAVITAVLGLWLTAAGNTLTAVAMAVILWSNRSGRAS
jgi:hypothetical protein